MLDTISYICMGIYIGIILIVHVRQAVRNHAADDLHSR